MQHMRGLLSGLIALTLASAPGHTQHNQSPGPSALAIDSAMLSLAARVVGNAARIDSVWPGFWSAPEFILHRSDRVALLYSTRGPRPGYAPLRAEGLPAGLRSRTYILTGRVPPEKGQRLDRNKPFFPYAHDLDESFAPGVHTLSRVDYLLHESFHYWQERAFKRERSCVPQWYPRSLSLPEGFRDAVAAELTLLAGAVRETEEARIRAQARAYLTRRMQRLATAVPLVTHIEQRQELLEGPARFVGNAGHFVVQEQSLAGLPHALAAALYSLHARAMNPTVSHGAEQAGRMYGAGAALADLLRRLGARGWRAATQQGRPLDELLAAHIGFQEYLTWVRTLPAPEDSCVPPAAP